MASIYTPLTFYIAAEANTAYADDVDARTDVSCGRFGSPGMTLLVVGSGAPVRQVGRRMYGGSQRQRAWLLCGVCAEPSVVDGGGRQWPPFSGTEQVPALTGAVAEAFDEATTALAARCFASCEMVCRKLLVYVAVEQGAGEWAKAKSFAAYVDDLATEGYLTPPMRRLADHIRDRGNATTHELPATTEEDARQTLGFTALLLRNIYEVPPAP